jgi:hypothetical protein
MAVESASDKHNVSNETQHVEFAQPGYIRRSYGGGLRGKALMRAITLAGGIGFLLFGYDQGVLSVGLALPCYMTMFATNFARV